MTDEANQPVSLVLSLVSLSLLVPVLYLSYTAIWGASDPSRPVPGAAGQQVSRPADQTSEPGNRSRLDSTHYPISRPVRFPVPVPRRLRSTRHSIIRRSVRSITLTTGAAVLTSITTSPPTTAELSVRDCGWSCGPSTWEYSRPVQSPTSAREFDQSDRILTSTRMSDAAEVGRRCTGVFAGEATCGRFARCSPRTSTACMRMLVRSSRRTPQRHIRADAPEEPCRPALVPQKSVRAGGDNALAIDPMNAKLTRVACV